MNIEETRPHHCLARAQRLLAEVNLVREEVGRLPDGRAAVTISDAQPRDCYFEALATWTNVDRLAGELGVDGVRFDHVTPPLTKILPGHVLQVIDAVLGQVDAIKQRLGVSEKAAEPATDNAKTPSDVLTTLVSVNRELSRSLERPFAPGDCYRIVSLASAYATRLGAVAKLAPFERKKKPADCYQRLTACHTAIAAKIAKRGQGVMTARSVPTDALPGDVYNLACLVLGELTFLHALTPDAAPVHTLEPAPTGHRLPSHVDQLARTLEAQLDAIA
jgi:hypothetical protein